MKKWLIVLSTLVALSLLAAPLTLAGDAGGDKAGKAKGKAKFQCEATVVSVDAATGALVVTVKSGTKTIKAYLGKQIPGLQIGPEAKLVDATVHPSVPLTLDKLVFGARVRLRGTIDRSQPEVPVFTATKVVLKRLPVTTP